MKIPKIIHYCWFGGKPLPDLAQKCIASWKKFCPDYEIKRWDENNYDVKKIPYTAEAYEAKKYAFVSDYARFDILYEQGGLYFDTDVEVIKPLDELLRYDAVSGFESATQIPTGLMACRDFHPLFVEFLDDYKARHFLKEDGTFDTETNVTRITNICKKYGFVGNNTLQTIAGFTVYPTEYFCPKDYETGRIFLTENTYTIHHFDASWHSDAEKKYTKARQKIYSKFHGKFAKFLLLFPLCKMLIKKNGIKWFFAKVVKKIFCKNQNATPRA